MPAEKPTDLGVNDYGVILIFDAPYRYIRYISVMGEECIYATHIKQWVKKNDISEDDLTAKYNEGYNAGAANKLATLTGTWKSGYCYMNGWTPYGGVQEAQINNSTGTITITDNTITINLSGGGNENYYLRGNFSKA